MGCFTTLACVSHCSWKALWCHTSKSCQTSGKEWGKLQGNRKVKMGSVDTVWKFLVSRRTFESEQPRCPFSWMTCALFCLSDWGAADVRRGAWWHSAWTRCPLGGPRRYVCSHSCCWLNCSQCSRCLCPPNELHMVQHHTVCLDYWIVLYVYKAVCIQSFPSPHQMNPPIQYDMPSTIQKLKVHASYDSFL